MHPTPYDNLGRREIHRSLVLQHIHPTIIEDIGYSAASSDDISIAPKESETLHHRLRQVPFDLRCLRQDAQVQTEDTGRVSGGRMGLSR